jgi:DHA2 family multidrug resistance protein-like MFS transporter
VFLLALPVMLGLLALGPFLLPEYRDANAGRLDFASATLSLFAVLAAIYGMKAWAKDGFGWVPAVSILAAAAVGAAFVRRQGRLADPLIDLRLLRTPTFRVSLATFTITTAIVFGSYIYIAQYLQLVLGLSPLAAGLWMLPGSIGVIVGSMLAPMIVRRAAPATVIGGGLGLAALGFTVLAQVLHAGLLALVAGSSLVYLGLGPVFTLGTDLIVGAAPPERAGAAAAMSETSSELGGALGIAVFGSLGTALYRSAMSPILDSLPPAVRVAARETLGGATAAAERLQGAAGAELLATARHAFAHGLAVTATVCALIAAATAVTALLLLRRIHSGAERAITPASTEVGGAMAGA